MLICKLPYMRIQKSPYMRILIFEYMQIQISAYEQIWISTYVKITKRFIPKFKSIYAQARNAIVERILYANCHNMRIRIFEYMQIQISAYEQIWISAYVQTTKRLIPKLVQYYMVNSWNAYVPQKSEQCSCVSDVVPLESRM
jgi:hypothetical protein